MLGVWEGGRHVGVAGRWRIGRGDIGEGLGVKRKCVEGLGVRGTYTGSEGRRKM